jgi:hypothetical protein
MLIVLRPTPGWAVEDFEVVWEHDLSPEDYHFFYALNSFYGNKIYALSSDVDNFLVYQDDFFSFKVLELSTGNFVKKIVLDSSFWPEQDGISNMQLIENKTKLAVAVKNDYFYIYDVKTWELIRKVEARGILAIDGKLLLSPMSGSGGYIYDFATMKQINNFSLEEPGGYSAGWLKILISNDGKKAAFSRLLNDWHNVPAAYICEVYDLETKQRLCRYVSDKSSDIFINSDLSKLYRINGNTLYEYDINKQKWVDDTYAICDQNNFRSKISENQKFVFCSGYNYITAHALIKTLPTYHWTAGILEAGFLDIGKDYFLALRNITDSSASMIKVKINIEAITPVDEKSNNIEVLYPNPTNSNVHLPNVKIQNISEIKVSNEQGYDISKKCIISILPFGIDINMQKLITGIYFIQINTATISKTYKTIKN